MPPGGLSLSALPITPPSVSQGQFPLFFSEANLAVVDRPNRSCVADAPPRYLARSPWREADLKGRSATACARATLRRELRGQTNDWKERGERSCLQRVATRALKRL